MSDTRKEQSTTGEREAIAKRAASAAVDAFLARDRTPPMGQIPRSEDSSEHIRKIARDEAERTSKAMITEYQNNCINSGPICGVWEEIGRMRETMSSHDKIISEFVGAQKLSRWLVPMAASLASSALAVALLKLLWAR